MYRSSIVWQAENARSILGLALRPEPEECIGASAGFGLHFHEKDFGFPGERALAKGRLRLLYSLGEKNRMFAKYSAVSGHGTHNIGFGFNGYLNTDSTSQITGQIDYSYVRDGFALVVSYENDTIFLLQDRYRTAAVRITSLFDTGRDLLGLSIGFSLWAGERIIDLWKIWNNGAIRMPDEVRRGGTIALYNGKDHSTDAVYFSLRYGNMSLSIGYDSEGTNSSYRTMSTTS